MGFDIGYSAAAMAGLLSFLSPCILPIVPFYLCYLAGVSFDGLTQSDGADPAQKRRIVSSAVLFSLGIITIFIVLGATASVIGAQFREWFDVIRYAAASIILLLGLRQLGILKFGFLDREARLHFGNHVFGIAGAYFVGMAFAFGWTPCVGPILAMILFTAGAEETAQRGAVLLLFYGVGMTVPFVLAALFVGTFLKWAKRFRRHLPLVERMTGTALILFALLIASDSVSIIANWMLGTAPFLSDIG